MPGNEFEKMPPHQDIPPQTIGGESKAEELRPSIESAGTQQGFKKDEEQQDLERKRKIEHLEEEIESFGEKGRERKRRLLKIFRLPSKYKSEPVPLSTEDQEIISVTVNETAERLQQNYSPGFGVSPAALTDENYSNQVWSRDFAHAAGNYFVDSKPLALEDSLETILRHQKPNGMLPLRVEREYMQIKFIPGLRFLARPLFNLVESKIKKRNERPIYEGGDLGASGAEDTVPAILIAAGEFFISSEAGREFVKKHYDQLCRAVGFFETKVDSSDGLAIIKRKKADWADTINRTGELGVINVIWARSLRLMAYLAKELGDTERASEYSEKFQQVKNSIMEKIYNSQEGYFRAKAGEDRLDTVASIFGALYLLDPEEAVKVEESLKKRVERSSGLQNFDPSYQGAEIDLMRRLVGWEDYHNKLVWPWVTCENIQVKIKIALQHPDEAIRQRYKKEAVEDFIRLSKIFKDSGGAGEVLDPNSYRPAKMRSYRPVKNFMGSMTAYQGAYGQLKQLGWL